MSQSEAFPLSHSASGTGSAGTPVSGERPAQALPQPTLIGRYALFGKIGAGGMGVVHLGRLLGSAGFERAVAIKRVHPSLASDQKFISMFRQELQLMARVRHQNVISALDVVEVDGELLLVMEYVHGESLASLLQRSLETGQHISCEMAVTIACGALKGLHAAHTATDAAGQPLDVIHRDISPHNVLVGCDGLARVLDFGVAKSVGSRQLTRVGELRGKPGYVAPEQIRSGGRVTRAADIYALSVVLWEMLAGQRLFSKRSLPETIEAVLAGNIPPLAAVTIRDVPDSLEAIVRRGLSAEAQDRFASARDMATALEQEVRLLSPEEVGEWVTSTAESALTQRGRQLSWAETCPIGDTQTLRADSTHPSRQFEAGAMTRELPLEAIAPALLRRELAPASVAPATAPANKGSPLLYVAAGLAALLFGASQLGLFDGSSPTPAPSTRSSSPARVDPPPVEAPPRPQPRSPSPEPARAANSAVSTEPTKQAAPNMAPRGSARAELPTTALSNPYRQKPAATTSRRAAAKPKAPSIDGF